MSIVNRSSQDYWTQTISCERNLIHKFELIYKLAINGKNLHVGCTDYPLENPGTLHTLMLNNNVDIDGYDVDEQGILKLREMHPGKKFFTSLDNLDQEYDLVIIPEVLEHVTSHVDFFKALENVRFKKYMISVPNALSKETKFAFKEDASQFFEMVHPDHKCWYSPYTIVNLIESVAKWKIEKVYLMHGDSQVIVIGTKN